MSNPSNTNNPPKQPIPQAALKAFDLRRDHTDRKIESELYRIIHQHKDFDDLHARVLKTLWAFKELFRIGASVTEEHGVSIMSKLKGGTVDLAYMEQVRNDMLISSEVFREKAEEANGAYEVATDFFSMAQEFVEEIRAWAESAYSLPIDNVVATQDYLLNKEVTYDGSEGDIWLVKKNEFGDVVGKVVLDPALLNEQFDSIYNQIVHVR